ncbi:MAG: serine hydrolase [Proteobacteria bacterium]|nr:serine hydrolase [Pseudomonadota bacterium]
MHTSVRFLLSLTLAFSPVIATSAEIYFPGRGESWETIDPSTVGWNAERLSAALDIAGERNSSGVVILHNGRIMAERYWNLAEAPAAYRSFVQGTDSLGRAIEDVASAQKSVVAVISGMAQERGYLDIDDPVNKHLGSGWSRAHLAQEQAITLRALFSMNSGLAANLEFAAEPGSIWLYNTPAYHLVMQVVEAATGKDRHALTREWITAPLGMENSSWTPRPWADAAIGVGFSTTARELARFGLMIQAGGRWQDRTIIEDARFLEQMLSPSQPLNPSYGLLWWVNGQEFSLGADPQATPRRRTLIPSAPMDLVAMQGAMDRKLYLVPSLELVVTRLGSTGSRGGSNFNDAFWEALMKAAPTH